MVNDLEMFCELYDMAVVKLANMREKFRKNGGEIPNNDVDLFDKLTHSTKSLKTTIAMLESEDPSYSNAYHGPYYSQGNSYRGNSSQNRNRMGRYSSANSLHNMIDNLPEDKMMQVQRYIEEMGRM